MAELDLKERQAGDVTILDLSGSVRMGEGAISSVILFVVWWTRVTRRFFSISQP